MTKNNDITYDRSKGPKVEVITQTQRRRRWSAIEKKQIVEELKRAKKHISDLVK